MVRYTLEDESLVFNRERQKAYRALEGTVDSLYGREEVTERVFRDAWLERISGEGNPPAGGWYCPPPFGMAVLTGSRLSFDSLRNPEYWPGNDAVDWKEGSLYAYASPVDPESGWMGDLSVTLCFDREAKLAGHIRNCHEAVMELFGRTVIESFGTYLGLSEEKKTGKIDVNAVYDGHCCTMDIECADGTIYECYFKDGVLAEIWHFANEALFMESPSGWVADAVYLHSVTGKPYIPNYRDWDGDLHVRRRPQN